MSADFLSPGKASKAFDPDKLTRSIIAIPLLSQIMAEEKDARWLLGHLHNRPEEKKQFESGEIVAIFLNPDFKGGPEAAWKEAEEIIRAVIRRISPREKPALRELEGDDYKPFVLGRLSSPAVMKIMAQNSARQEPPIKHITRSWFNVIIDVNLEHPLGRKKAREMVESALKDLAPPHALRDKGDVNGQYIFARLDSSEIWALLEHDLVQARKAVKSVESHASSTTGSASKNVAKMRVRSRRVIQASADTDPRRYLAIHSIWPDFPITACITKSLATVKADAAQSSFSANGIDITWAVMDSGIDAGHNHFKLHGNIDPESPLHGDFTGSPATPDKKGKKSRVPSALRDAFGHGTHVAGIVAGEQTVGAGKNPPDEIRAVVRSVQSYNLDNTPRIVPEVIKLNTIRGMAPRCRLVSLKVLDDDGHGEVSNLMAAIAHIQEKNSYGSRILIHGVNISLGYEFDPEWFACGQSPLCVVINRLVRSGVVVVVAAGNTGYGTLDAQQRTTNAGMMVTINDPGNADLAITVGATHREMPHMFGVSYFSSKGPTGDGRLKPDLVAPGEKVLSAATGAVKDEKGDEKRTCEYVEDSGTSMAAPHVSGAIAAFLSVRREFLGEPERVKKIFLATATDLQRDRYFQGAGLVDLMRAIQSV